MRKQIKVLRSILAAIFLLITLCSCISKEIEPRWLNPLDEVCRVDIVVFRESPDAPESAYYQEWFKIEPAPDIIKTLSDEDMKKVISALETIEAGRPGMDVDGIQEGAIGFMLTYRNGDYEIISRPSSFQHREADNMNWRQAGYCVDQNTLARLLTAYSDGFWVYGDRFWIETEKDDLYDVINASGSQAE